MKRIKMGIIALATIVGIGGAFAFNQPPKRTGTLYFGVGTPSNFQWFRSPSGDCGGSNIQNAACTITSTYDVTGPAFANQLPAGANIQNASGGKLYQ